MGFRYSCDCIVVRLFFFLHPQFPTTDWTIEISRPIHVSATIRIRERRRVDCVVVVVVVGIIIIRRSVVVVRKIIIIIDGSSSMEYVWGSQ